MCTKGRRLLHKESRRDVLLLIKPRGVANVFIITRPRVLCIREAEGDDKKNYHNVACISFYFLFYLLCSCTPFDFIVLWVHQRKYNAVLISRRRRPSSLSTLNIFFIITIAFFFFWFPPNSADGKIKNKPYLVLVSSAIIITTRWWVGTFIL